MALRNGSIETFENVTDVSVSSKWIQVIAAWIEQKQGKSFYSIETLPCKESKWIRFVLVNIFIFKYSCRNVLSYTSTWLGSFHIGSISQPFVINFYLWQCQHLTLNIHFCLAAENLLTTFTKFLYVWNLFRN